MLSLTFSLAVLSRGQCSILVQYCCGPRRTNRNSNWSSLSKYMLLFDKSFHWFVGFDSNILVWGWGLDPWWTVYSWVSPSEVVTGVAGVTLWREDERPREQRDPNRSKSDFIILYIINSPNWMVFFSCVAKASTALTIEVVWNLACTTSELCLCRTSHFNTVL